MEWVLFIVGLLLGFTIGAMASFRSNLVGELRAAGQKLTQDVWRRLDEGQSFYASVTIGKYSGGDDDGDDDEPPCPICDEEPKDVKIVPYIESWRNN